MTHYTPASRSRGPVGTGPGMKRTALIFAAVLLAPLASLNAQLGLPREAYGVWDREGNNTVAAYPFTRGQAYANTWQNVNSARHTFDWSGLDAQLQFADSQNENLIIQIAPVGGGSNGVPPWIVAAKGGAFRNIRTASSYFGITSIRSQRRRALISGPFGQPCLVGRMPAAQGSATARLLTGFFASRTGSNPNLKAQQLVRLIFGKDQT
jgi:hypothetical protein